MDNNWIKVEDKLPEEDMTILGSNGVLVMEAYYRSSKAKFLNIEGWEYDDSEITHWMPLPPPPQQNK